MGKCCVAGAGESYVDEKKKEMRVKGQTFKEGDWISLDGTTGRVIKGKLNTLEASPDDPALVKFMAWADPTAVSASAPMPTFPATPKPPSPSEPKASASAAPSTCSLPRTAFPSCAP